MTRQQTLCNNDSIDQAMIARMPPSVHGVRCICLTSNMQHLSRRLQPLEVQSMQGGGDPLAALEDVDLDAGLIVLALNDTLKPSDITNAVCLSTSAECLCVDFCHVPTVMQPPHTETQVAWNCVGLCALFVCICFCHYCCVVSFSGCVCARVCACVCLHLPAPLFCLCVCHCA